MRRLILHTENRVKVYLSAEDLYTLMKQRSEFYMDLAKDIETGSFDDYWVGHALAIDSLMSDIDAKMHGTFYPHKR